MGETDDPGRTALRLAPGDSGLSAEDAWFPGSSRQYEAEKPKPQPDAPGRTVLQPRPRSTSDAVYQVDRAVEASQVRRGRTRWAEIVSAGAVLVFVAAAVWIGAQMWFAPPTPLRAPHEQGTFARKQALAAQGAYVAPLQTDPDAIRKAIESALPGIGCTWLGIEEVLPNVMLSGVAADSATVARTISDLLARRGVNAPVDVSRVFAVKGSACGVIDAFRAFRAPGISAIKAAQPDFHVQSTPHNCTGVRGSEAAVVVTDFSLSERNKDFAVLAVNNSGEIQDLISSRDEFLSLMTRRISGWDDLGGSHYRWTVCIPADSARQSPVSAFLLVTGRGPFSMGLPSDRQIAASRSWINIFETLAREGGWTTQMAWFRVDPN